MPVQRQGLPVYYQVFNQKPFKGTKVVPVNIFSHPLTLFFFPAPLNGHETVYPHGILGTPLPPPRAAT